MPNPIGNHAKRFSQEWMNNGKNYILELTSEAPKKLDARVTEITAGGKQIPRYGTILRNPERFDERAKLLVDKFHDLPAIQKPVSEFVNSIK